MSIDELTRRRRHIAVRHWLASFLPAALSVGWGERLRASVGALIGIMITALTGLWIMGPSEHLPILIAPIGASAVLLFAVPSGPLAQPWPILGGNTLSALVGISCLMLFEHPAVAAGMAVGLALGVMFLARCLHPPGGAVALTTVLGGSYVLEQGYGFAFAPVALQSALLVLTGLIFNNLTGRRYPHATSATPATAPARTDDARAKVLGFTHEDLENVLKRYEQVVDISPADLQSLLKQTEMQAYRRRMGEFNCGDIMSRDVVSVRRKTDLETAWSLLGRHRIKALPVIDDDKVVIGIITQSDFMRLARYAEHEGFGKSLRRILRHATRRHRDEPGNVEELMTSPVETARAEMHIAELVPLLSEEGRHHVPIVDHGGHLIGIVTQTDLVAALYSGAARQAAA